MKRIIKAVLVINDNLIKMSESDYRNFVTLEKEIQKVNREIKKLKKMKGGQYGKIRYRRSNQPARK